LKLFIDCSERRLLPAASLHADVVVDLAGRAGVIGHAAFAVVVALLAGIRGLRIRDTNAANQQNRKRNAEYESHQDAP
jgi:hypothetical protein